MPVLTMDRGTGPVRLLADADVVEPVVAGVTGFGTVRGPIDPAADLRVQRGMTVRVTRFAERPNGQSRRHAST